MEQTKIPKKRFAAILGITNKKLQSLDAKKAKSKKKVPQPDHYTLADLSEYRSLGKMLPKARAQRQVLFLNFKGGTGKTSISVSYAYRLAEMGHRVLLLDLDSQAHATQCLGYDGESYEHTLFDVLVSKKPLQSVIHNTPLTQLDFVPANLQMSTVELSLMPLASRESRLHRAITGLKNKYDYIIMDAPPSFGLLNLNALLAATDLIIPVLPDFLSYHGLKLLFETISDVQEDLELQLENIWVLINQFNPTTKIAKEARGALQSHYADYLTKTIVRQCTKFAQASSDGKPIFLYEPNSKGATDIQALIDETTKSFKRTTPKEQRK